MDELILRNFVPPEEGFEVYEIFPLFLDLVVFLHLLGEHYLRSPYWFTLVHHLVHLGLP